MKHLIHVAYVYVCHNMQMVRVMLANQNAVFCVTVVRVGYRVAVFCFESSLCFPEIVIEIRVIGIRFRSGRL